MIIAAAGLAAHLAGAAASRSLLPVIGIPLAAGTLGLDALLSTVPMPPGVPVATVGVGEHREGQRAKVLEADAGIGRQPRQ